jgi:hypothetical protein
MHAEFQVRHGAPTPVRRAMVNLPLRRRPLGFRSQKSRKARVSVRAPPLCASRSQEIQRFFRNLSLTLNASFLVSTLELLVPEHPAQNHILIRVGVVFEHLAAAN